jgi:hypothetical protein
MRDMHFCRGRGVRLDGAAVIITQHARERWIERVDPKASPEDAMLAIRASSHAVEAAISFGARIVRLGCGAKLVIHGGAVVTVLSRRGIAAGHLGERLS